MDDALLSAIGAKDLPRCRSRILEIHAKARTAVGLPAASGLTALQLAALHEAAAAAQLIAHGVVCDLHSACALGRTADIARLATPAACAAVAEHLTPMGFALVRGQVASVRALLAAGDDPHRSLARIGFFVWELAALAAGHGRWQPLHAAAAHGYAPDAADIARALIDAGANIEAVCPLGERPLHLAATYGWLPVLEALIDAGAQVDAPTAETPVAVWKMASPETATPVWAQTALMIAAREGAESAAKRLLGAGAQLNATDSSGATALHIAARPWWRENTSLVTLLLNAGANPNVRDHRGRTPADLASATGHNASTRLLRQRP